MLGLDGVAGKRGISLLAAFLLMPGMLLSCDNNASGDETDSVPTDTTGIMEDSEWQNGDIFLMGDHISEVCAPVKDTMIQYAANLIGSIYDTYLKGGSHKVVVSVIPDKNYYLAETAAFQNSEIPLADYAHLTEQIQTGCADFASYVDLFPHLELADYFYQDAHWKQEMLPEIAALFLEAFGDTASGEYETEEWASPFVGSYSDEPMAAEAKTDTLYYLKNDTLSTVKVTNYSDGTPSDGVLYNLDHPADKNTYDMFLSGPMPLQILENPDAATDRELILFRDSFGASIAPLFCEVYQKITLVDLRYISSSVLGDYITFDDQDVLFLYCTHILNTAMILK